MLKYNFSSKKKKMYQRSSSDENISLGGIYR